MRREKSGELAANPTSVGLSMASGDIEALSDTHLLLGAVVWGEKFVEDFSRFALASLLSPGNIPAVLSDVPSPAARFLIATDPADRCLFDARPEMSELRRWMKVEYLALPEGGDALERMSVGHRLITARFAAEGRVAGIVYPDSIYADGTLRWAAAETRKGAKLATTACPRTCSDTLATALFAHRKDGVLQVSKQQLASAALGHLHDEFRRCLWSSDRFADQPAVCAWPLPVDRDPPDAVVLHSLCWAPVLIDYGAIANHDSESLEAWTIDGDYLFRNVGSGDDGAVAIPHDADDAMIISLSDPSRGIIDLRSRMLMRLPVLGERVRRALVRLWLNDPAIDPLKKNLFKIPVLWGVCSKTVLDETKAEASAALAPVFGPVRAGDHLLYWFFSFRLQLGERVWFVVTWPVSKLPLGIRRRIRGWLGRGTQ